MKTRYWIPLASIAVALGVACQDAAGPTGDDLSLARAGASAGLQPPAGVTATALSPSEIALAWVNRASKASGVEVSRSQSGGAYLRIATTAAGVQAHQDPGLAPETRYCYVLRAFRTTGGQTSYSAGSTAACATTPAPPPPPPPPTPPPPPPPTTPPAAASNATASLELSFRVRVDWTDNSTDEQAFRFEQSTDGGVSWSVAFNMGDNSTWMHIDVPTEQLACFRVVAYNAAGDAPPSNTACIVPGPSAPSGLTVTLFDAQTLDFAWTDNSGLDDGYQVWVARCVSVCNADGSADPWLIATLPANSTSFRASRDSVVGLWLWVVATKNGIASEPSNFVQAP